MQGGLSNTSHFVTAGAEQFVLTVVDNPFTLEAEHMHELLTTLASAGIAVPRVLTTKSGEPFVKVGQHTIRLTRFVAGICYQLLPDDLIAKVGATMAEIHGVRYDKPLSASTRDALPGAIATVSEQAEPWFVEWIHETIERMRPIADLAGPSGLTHGDLFADNVIFANDGRLVVLDWETSCIDLFIVDIATSITGIAGHHESIDAHRASLFVKGYERVRKLDTTESELLVLAIEYAAFALAIWRFRRHNIHFPDPSTANRYIDAIRRAESVRTNFAITR